MRWFLAFLGGFSAAFALLLFKPRTEIGCFPYLERIALLRKEAIKGLFANPKLTLRLFDEGMRGLNEEVKNSEKLLLDCHYVCEKR